MIFISKKTRYLPYFLVAGAIVFFIGMNLNFTLRHHQGPSLDENQHLVKSLRYFHNNWEAAFEDQYPPLYYVVTFLIYTFFDTSRTAALLANQLFLILLVTGVFLIAEKFDPGGLSTWLSVWFSLLFPILYFLSRIYILDFSATAMVSLSIAALVWTNEFEKRNWSIFFGILAGLGMLTRLYFALFIAGPTLVIACKAFIQDKLRRQRRHNMAVAFLLILLISGFWYIHDLYKKIQFAHSRLVEPPISGNLFHKIFELAVDFLKFLYNLIFFDISLWLFVLAVMGIVLFFSHKHKGRLVLFSWIILPMAVFFFIPGKVVRFMAPAIPAIGLASAFGISGIRKPLLRILLMSIFLVIGLFQLMMFTFYCKPDEPYWYTQDHLPARLFSYNSDPFQYKSHRVFWSGPPRMEETVSENLAEMLESLPVEQKDSLRVIHCQNMDDPSYNEKIDLPYASLYFYLQQKWSQVTLTRCFWDHDGNVILYTERFDENNKEGAGTFMGPPKHPQNPKLPFEGHFSSGSSFFIKVIESDLLISDSNELTSRLSMENWFIPVIEKPESNPPLYIYLKKRS